MLQYLLLMLRHQKSRGMLAGGGFFLAACALVLLSATTLTTVVQAKQIISQNWRSSYDLVVLPPGASIPTGKPVSVDTFQGYDGGISIQQYEQIKKLPGVAVAAPLAFIGYVQFPYTYFQIGPSPAQPGYYQFEWTQTAFDGRHQVIENHHVQRVYVAPGSESCSFSHACYQSGSVTYALGQLGVSGGWNISGGQYRDAIPDVGTYLLAAIDPTAEEQLFQLKAGLIRGRLLATQDRLHLDSTVTNASSYGVTVPNYDMPMLLNTPTLGQVTLHTSFVRFVTSTLDPGTLVAQKGSTALDHLPQQVLFSGTIPLARNDPQLFGSGVFLKLNGDSWQVQKDTYNSTVYASNFLNFIAVPASPQYQTATAPAGQNSPSYRLVPNQTQPQNSTNVAFRSLTPLPNDEHVHLYTENANTTDSLPNTYNGAVYTPQVVGVLDGKRIEAEFTHALSWLPEGAYASTPYTLRYDAQGHPIQPSPVLSTSQQGSFVQQQPFALTTLAAAERVRGQDCISVIRVRVAGNISPDDTGLRRVAQIAQDIQRSTGLRAIVTLGSAPQSSLIYVPGIKVGQNGATQSINPLGWVEERWINIGVGVTYLSQLGQTQTLFLGAVLLVCLGYLVVTLNALVVAQRREMAILGAIGWEPWQPVSIFLVQVFLLALGGGIIGIGVALLIVALIGASPPWLIVAWTLPIIIMLAFLSALYPLWQLWRVQPAEVLREGMSVSSTRSNRLGSWLGSFLPAVLNMALRNLARSRLRTVIALGCLFLSAGLLTTMIDGLLVFRQVLQGTQLGNYILLQTAVPQLAGAIFAVILTFLSVADLLLLQVRERGKEIGLLQAVGWPSRMVQRLFVHEGLALALLGAIPGVLVSLGILLEQHEGQTVIPVAVIAVGAVGMMLIVASLATLPAIHAINRLPLMDVLRSE
ncbi:MAG: FtsX-like permease family protein [Ktedonobacteraceae bacterium]